MKYQELVILLTGYETFLQTWLSCVKLYTKLNVTLIEYINV